MSDIPDMGTHCKYPLTGLLSLASVLAESDLVHRQWERFDAAQAAHPGPQTPETLKTAARTQLGPAALPGGVPMISSNQQQGQGGKNPMYGLNKGRAGSTVYGRSAVPALVDHDVEDGEQEYEEVCQDAPSSASAEQTSTYKSWHTNAQDDSDDVQSSDDDLGYEEVCDTSTRTHMPQVAGSDTVLAVDLPSAQAAGPSKDVSHQRIAPAASSVPVGIPKGESCSTHGQWRCSGAALQICHYLDEQTLGEYRAHGAHKKRGSPPGWVTLPACPLACSDGQYIGCTGQSPSRGDINRAMASSADADRTAGV